MRNNRAHTNPFCITLQGAVIASGIILTYFIISGVKIQSSWMVAFAIILFSAQFIHLMFGIKNPIGYVLMIIIVLSSLLMLKVFYSFPDSWLAEGIMDNLIYVVPGFVFLDILRNLTD